MGDNFGDRVNGRKYSTAVTPGIDGNELPTPENIQVSGGC